MDKEKLTVDEKIQIMSMAVTVFRDRTTDTTITEFYNEILKCVTAETKEG